MLRKFTHRDGNLIVWGQCEINIGKWNVESILNRVNEVWRVECKGSERLAWDVEGMRQRWDEDTCPTTVLKKLVGGLPSIPTWHRLRLDRLWLTDCRFFFYTLRNYKSEYSIEDREEFKCRVCTFTFFLVGPASSPLSWHSIWTNWLRVAVRWKIQWENERYNEKMNL